jgi:hypothetical protein
MRRRTRPSISAHEAADIIENFSINREPVDAVVKGDATGEMVLGGAGCDDLQGNGGDDMLAGERPGDGWAILSFHGTTSTITAAAAPEAAGRP